MSKHTLGKLHHHDMEAFTACSEDGGAVFLSEATKRSDEENEANAYRLIECWNVCADLANPAAAPLLKEALECLVHRCDAEGVISWAPLDDARAALAATEEPKR